ncbi:transposase [Streptomyces sp. NBC_00876]|uniref:transposase n=1 Tax=Streptomyces sp. NBC_00876 TaxID=2975853 RepID=UPI0038660EC1|nr:transposase [Streptomyces sp. NBC_00876]
MTPPHAKTWSPRGRTPVVRVRGRYRRRISIAALTCCKDNVNVHKAAGLREFPASRDWLTIYYLPPYAPDLNPVEGIWSLLRRGRLSNVAFSTPEHLVQRIRLGLRHIQYRSHLIDGCLAETGPTISPV